MTLLFPTLVLLIKALVDVKIGEGRGLDKSKMVILCILGPSEVRV